MRLARVRRASGTSSERMGSGRLASAVFQHTPHPATNSLQQVPERHSKKRQYDHRCPTSTATLKLKTRLMHTIEPKAAFLVMRSNGWSLGKISEKLNIPRSTLFDWSGQMQQEVHYLKCFQVEKLQEKYIPSFEEEL